MSDYIHFLDALFADVIIAAWITLPCELNSQRDQSLTADDASGGDGVQFGLFLLMDGRDRCPMPSGL